MMNAVYKNRAYRLLEPETEAEGWSHHRAEDIETGEVVLLDGSEESLIIDPTDDEFFACENAPPTPQRVLDEQGDRAIATLKEIAKTLKRAGYLSAALILSASLAGATPDREKPATGYLGPPVPIKVHTRPPTDSWLCQHISPFFCPIYPTLNTTPAPKPTPERGRK